MYISRRAKKALLIAALLIVGLLFACASPATTPTPLGEASVPATTTPSLPKPSGQIQTTTPPAESTALPDRVDVVYFHRANQCHCMQVIEENIHDTVISNFQEELDSGKLTFTSLASDDRANAAMVRKYNTRPFGLFITIVKGKTEKIVPVEEIWSMTGDEVKYKEYVKNIIAKSLKGQA